MLSPPPSWRAAGHRPGCERQGAAHCELEIGRAIGRQAVGERQPRHTCRRKADEFLAERQALRISAGEGVGGSPLGTAPGIIRRNGRAPTLIAAMSSFSE
jgi:hypothetical protein